MKTRLTLTCFVPLVSLLLVCQSKVQPISKSTFDVQESLTKCIIACIETAILSNFDRITYSLPPFDTFSSKTYERSLIRIITASSGKAITVKKLNKPIWNFRHKREEKSNVFIIHFTNQTGLQNQIDKMKQLEILNPVGKFLLYSSEILENKLNITVELTKYLWNENIYDSVIILRNGDDNTTFDIITWHPYKNANCGKHFDEDSYMHERCSFGFTNERRKWFGMKIPKSYEECDIKVHYIHKPPYVMVSEIDGTKKVEGVEIRLISTIAETLKFKIVHPIVKNNKRGEIYKNLTMTGVFEEFGNKNVDIAIGGYAKTPNIALTLDSSLSYTQDSLIWCVSHITSKSQFERIVGMLRLQTLMILLTLKVIITLLINYVSRQNRNELNYFTRFESTFLDVYTIFMNSPIIHVPRTERVRTFLGFYMLFSFIFRIAYNSSLMSSLTTPTVNEKYASLRDIYENNLKTYFAPDFNFFFTNIDEIDGVPIDVIQKRWIECKRVRDCLHAFDRHSAICLSQLYYNYYDNFAIKGKIYCLTQSKINCNINIVMRKGFPLFYQINRIIMKLISGGFIQKWQSEHVSRKDFDNAGHKTVNLKELLPVFMIYLISLLMFTVILVIEIGVHRYKGKNKHVDNRVSFSDGNIKK